MRRIGTFLSVGCVFVSVSTGCDTGTEVTVGKSVNSPPSAVILSPGDGETFDEDTVIHFQAKVQDSADAPNELEVIWSSDVQGDLNSSALPDIDGNVLFSTANLEAAHFLLNCFNFIFDFMLETCLKHCVFAFG